jgi:hypothetical protein
MRREISRAGWRRDWDSSGDNALLHVDATGKARFFLVCPGKRYRVYLDGNIAMHFELGQVGEVIRIVGRLDEHGLAIVPALNCG